MQEKAPGRDKRRRASLGDCSDGEFQSVNKKHQGVLPDGQQPKQARPQILPSQRSGVVRDEATPLTLIVKSQHPSSSSTTRTQLPTQTSSNGSSERKSQDHSRIKRRQMIRRLEQQVSATPTLAEKICEEDLQDPAVSTASVPKSNNKWGRDAHNSAEGMSRRLRVSNNVKSIVERRSQPLQRPQARVVQPDSSFAPVARNPLCNLEFLDYDNSSVPVLYSTKIQHTRSTELQNCPSIDLVNDALDAI